MLSPTKAPAFPAEDQPAAQRGPDYYRAFAKAFYHDFVNRGPKIFYNQREVYERNRLYSQGLQDPNIYRRMLDAEENNPVYVQLDYTIVPVWPKFRDIILARMASRYCDVVATPIDAVSQEQEQAYRHEQLATIQNQDVAQGLGAIGVDVGQGPVLPEGVTQQVPMEQPQTPEELELFMQMAYKSRRAMAVEIATDVVFDDNGWTREVARQVREDFLDCGVGADRDYLDPASGRIRIRRCDPAMCLSGWSSRSDFRHVTRFGELLAMSVADVMTAGGTQLDEDDKRQMTSYAAGRGIASGQTPAGLSEVGMLHVLDCEWLGKDSLSLLRRGGVGLGLLPADYVAQEGDEVDTTQFETVYRCKWVVGTNVVFDFGIAPNQKRDRTAPAEGHLSFNVYGVNLQNMRVMPFTSRVIPIVDNYQLIHLKLQHLVATAKPKGVQVEFGALNGVLRGDGTEFEALELLRAYDQSGNLIYNRIDINGEATNGAPVKELENGLAADAWRLPQLKNEALNELRMVTGLNEVSDSSAPATNALNGTSQLALQATNLALQPLYDADDIMLEKTAVSVIARLQSRWDVYAGQSYYVQSMGRMVLKTIAEDPAISTAEMGVKIEARPSDALRQQLEADIQQSLGQRATTGKGGIEMEDAMIVRRLAEGNVKLAEQYLVLRRKKRQQDDERVAAQQVQLNTQQQQASAEQTAQAALQQLQVQSELRIQEAAKLAEIAEQGKQADHERAIELKNLDGQIKGQLIDLKGDIDLEMVQKKIEEYDAKTDHRTENIADGPNKRPS